MVLVTARIAPTGESGLPASEVVVVVLGIVNSAPDSNSFLSNDHLVGIVPRKHPFLQASSGTVLMHKQKQWKKVWIRAVVVMHT